MTSITDLSVEGLSRLSIEELASIEFFARKIFQEEKDPPSPVSHQGMGSGAVCTPFYQPILTTPL